MSKAFTESVVEEAALGWLGELDYAVRHGPDIAYGRPNAERSNRYSAASILSTSFVRRALTSSFKETPRAAARALKTARTSGSR